MDSQAARQRRHSRALEATLMLTEQDTKGNAVETEARAPPLTERDCLTERQAVLPRVARPEYLITQLA